MAPNSAASRLAKMMRSYRNGGYVYAQGSDEVADENWQNPNREQAEFVYDIVGSMMRDQPWYNTPLAYEAERLAEGDEFGDAPLTMAKFRGPAIEEALRLQKIDPKSEKGKLIAESVSNELERDFMRHFQEVAPKEAAANPELARGASPESYATMFKERLSTGTDDPSQSMVLTPEMEDYYPGLIGRPEQRQKTDPSGKPIYRLKTGEDPFEAALGYSRRGFTYMPESERTRPEFEPIERLQSRGPSRIPGGINQPGGMLEAALRNRGLMR